ncbi:sulfotransferase, partial [archaeon]
GEEGEGGGGNSPLTSLSMAQTQQTLSFFRPGFWPLQPRDFVGSPVSTPLFIVGFFRSGSTLLESLLGVHEGVRTMGEHSPFTFRMYDLQSDLIDAVSREEGEDLDEIYLHRLRGPLAKHADLLLREMQEHFTQSDAYRNITGETFPFTAKPPASTENAQRIVDKMLLNFRNIALIHLMFPHAVILHTVRDPLDTLLSCLSNRFGDQSSCSLDIPDMVLDYVLYLETIHHFHSVLPRLRYPLYTPPGQSPRVIERSALVDVRYEELVANPAKVMRRLFDIIGIQMPALDKLQRFHDSGRPVHTASFLQVKKPLYASSVGKWRKYAQGMKDTVIRELEKHLPTLRRKRALPYEHDGRSPMNWGLDQDFDYMEHLRRLV